MANFVVDSFNNPTALAVELSTHTPDSGGTWTKHPNQTDDIDIAASSHYIFGSAGSGSLYYHSAVPSSADYSITSNIFIFSNAVATYPSVVGRIDTSASTYYQAYYDQANTRWAIDRLVTGTRTTLDFFGQFLTNSQTYSLKLELIGTAIKIYVDGVLRISVTDSSISSAGKVGVAQYSTGGQQIGDFTAADIAVTPTGIPFFTTVGAM